MSHCRVLQISTLFALACACSDVTATTPSAPSRAANPVAASAGSAPAAVSGAAGRASGAGAVSIPAMTPVGRAGSPAVPAGAAGATSTVPGAAGGAGAVTTAGNGSAATAGKGAIAGSVGSTGAVGNAPLELPPVKFGPNIKINDDTGNAQQTEVMLAARPDGLILVSYVDNRSGTKCGFTVSKDAGATWSKTTLVPSLDRSGFTGDATVAIDDVGNLYAVCQDYGSTKQILLASSTNDGDTFSQFKVVNMSPDKPWIHARRDGTLFLTWLGNPGGYKRSLPMATETFGCHS